MPADPAFNFELSLYQGISDSFEVPPTSPAGLELSSLTSSDSSRLTSPLPSLTPSPAPSRPISPAPASAAHAHALLAPTASPEGVPSVAHPKPNPAVPANPAARKQKLKRRNKEKSKQKRKKQRAASPSYHPKEGRATRHAENATLASTAFNAEKIPVVKTGWLTRRTKGSKTVYNLKDVIGKNAKVKLELKEWKGKTTLVIVDDKKRIIAICLGVPKDDETWEDVHRRAASILESARDRLYFEKKDKDHRRGKFLALAVGISHGGGQKYPKLLEQDERNKEVWDEILNDDAFERISGFSAGKSSGSLFVRHILTFLASIAAFAEWAPRLYAYENDYLSKIIAHDQELRRTNKHPRPDEEELRRNWPKSPWAAATFNFGPQTVCYKHVDYNNLAFGWCSITALGDYDPTSGGHIILWELGLVIEFPPGATILIPSTAISHSNVRVRKNERRYSFTQYSAGGIFRYVDNHYQTVDKFMAGLCEEDRVAALDELSKQLEFGLSLYSDVPEFELRRRTTFKS